MENKPRAYGICTDTIMRNGEPILVDGKRRFGAIGWYRIVNPLTKLGMEYSIGYSVRTTADSAMELKEKGDIWLCKMADNEGIDHIYGTHRDFTGCKFVLDLDDEPDEVEKKHPDYEAIMEKRDMRIRMIKMADHVICSTPTIARSISKYNPYTTVIPNSIDPEIWKVKKPKKRKDGIVRIGWISSGSHFADMHIIQPAIKEVLDKYPNVEFHVAGMTWDNKEDGRIKHYSGTIGYVDFPQFYADMDIDIAIAPLKDSHFNRCKSNIKYLEASMLSIPTVASDVLPYQDIKHGKTGYLAKSSNQFAKYLSWLVENPTKRIEMGKEAKQYVLENWSIDKFLPLYTDLFNKLTEKKDITVVTAITGGKDELMEQPEYPGIDYLAFVDNEIQSPLWKTKRATDKFSKSVMNAKIYKILTHKYVDTPYIVWIDGNIKLRQDPRNLIKLMGDKDFAFFKHPGRNCLYDEADACVNLGKGNILEISEQVKDYAKKGFPLKAGLAEVPCFIRKNNKKANELFEKWWVEICRYSNRDQISFPVVFKGKKWAKIPGSVAYIEGNKDFPGNDYFKQIKHKIYE